MGVGGYLDFEIQVRVVSAPASNLVRTEARVLRVSDGTRTRLGAAEIAFFSPTARSE